MSTRRITIADAAERLGLSDEGVRKLVRRGDLAAERVGRRGVRVFKVKAVERAAGERAAHAFDKIIKAERDKGAAESRGVDEAIATGRWAPMGVPFRSLRSRGGSR